MTLLTQQRLSELAHDSSRLCISLYVDLHDLTGRKAEARSQRAEKVIRRAIEEGERWRRPAGAASVQDVLAPAMALLEQERFWRYQDRGLAIFASPAQFRAFRLPVYVPDAVHLGPRFNLRSLLPWLSDGARILLLSLSEREIRIFDGSTESCRLLDWYDLPMSLDEEIRFDGRRRSMQIHDGQRWIDGVSADGAGLKPLARAFSRLRPAGSVPLVVDASKPLRRALQRHPELQPLHLLAEDGTEGVEGAEADEAATPERGGSPLGSSERDEARREQRAGKRGAPEPLPHVGPEPVPEAGPVPPGEPRQAEEPAAEEPAAEEPAAEEPAAAELAAEELAAEEPAAAELAAAELAAEEPAAAELAAVADPDRSAPRAMSELRQIVVRHARRLHQRRQRGALHRFFEVPDGLGRTTDLGRVLVAARDGHVETLFVRPRERIWGRLHESAPLTLLADERRGFDDVDVLDVAAIAALTQGSGLAVLPGDVLPGGGLVAATMLGPSRGAARPGSMSGGMSHPPSPRK